MRYLALILILLAASKTMPVVEMEDAAVAAQEAPIVALSDVTVLSAVVVEERSEFTVASFTAPNRKPVRSWLASHQKPVLPEFLVEASAEVDAFEDGDATVEVFETAMQTQDVAEEPVEQADDATQVALVEPAVDEPEVLAADMRIVSASVLNMRAGPSSRNPIVGALSNGEMALVTGAEQKGWVPVRAVETDAEGWVFSRYLGPVEDS